MKKWFPIIVLLAISALFFYKTIFQFQIPFPGDLLISEYAPWKYESYLGYNPGSYPNKAQYFDVIRQLYPWKMLVIEELREGRLPMWNPYNFSGSPLLANLQSSVFNPFNVLFFIFSKPVSWSLYIMVQPIFAALFTFVYLKNKNLSSASSILGSVAFSFSLFMSTFLEYGNFGHTIMWLPLLLYIIDKSSDKNSRKTKIIFPLLVSIVFFAGHLQLAVGVLGITLLYVLSFAKSKKLFTMLFALGVGVASMQLVPTFELLANSSRVPHGANSITSNFLIQIHQLVLFITPDIYGNPATRNYLLKDTYPGNAIFLGIIPFVFAVMALVFARKNKYVVFFSSITAISLLFLVNNPISSLFYSFKIPLISTSSPSNFIFVLTFCLSVLGAYGFSLWEKSKNLKILYVTGSVILSYAFFYAGHLLFGIAHQQKQVYLGFAVLLVMLVVLFVSHFFHRKYFSYIFILITVIELFFYFHKFNPFVPASLLYPQTSIGSFLRERQDYSRFWGLGAGIIEANFATQLRTFSPEGYDPLYPVWYSEFIAEEKHGFSVRSDSRIDQSDIGETLSKNKSLMNKLNMLGVSYILDRVENGSSETTFPQDQFEQIYQEKGWIVMNNKSALPRVFTVDGECLLGNCPNDSINYAVVNSYVPGRIEISTPKGGRLVLLDTYYPGWKAYVDGKKYDVMRVNGAFMGVDGIGRNETVRFAYEPLSFKVGLIITIISCGLVTFVVLRVGKNEK